MRRRWKVLGVGVVVVAAAIVIMANWRLRYPEPSQVSATVVELPAAANSGGMALNDALAQRRSIRSFAARKLTVAEISQLLWAAQGITDEKGHRTAPSAQAQYYLHIYLAVEGGFYEFMPERKTLEKVSGMDVRRALSTQSTVKNAPAVFVVAGEYERAAKGNDVETAHRWVNLEAGMATENLLLEATALHLAVTSVGGFDPTQTAQAVGLPAGISPIFLVPTGHPK